VSFDIKPLLKGKRNLRRKNSIKRYEKATLGKIHEFTGVMTVRLSRGKNKKQWKSSSKGKIGGPNYQQAT